MFARGGGEREWDSMSREPSEIFGMSLAKPLGQRKAVEKEGCPAVTPIFDAVKQLERRHRIAIRIVGMRFERTRSIGQIVRVGDDTNVKQSSIVGLSNKS